MLIRLRPCVAGFLNKNELKHLENIKLSYNKYWAPLHWAICTCVKALEKEYFETTFAMICVQNVSWPLCGYKYGFARLSDQQTMERLKIQREKTENSNDSSTTLICNVTIRIQEIKAFRTNLALLCNFDWVPVPLAYPQVRFLRS
ncbi:unnamed protein product [Heligmosomoides polygyrus]|uniref:Bestrophin homolog n=1 Tax=Heligmosomoides polygyrus TaxID=6339 RepID=A0A183F9J6_HELPZ|nr:unnamed protein product [Heligmosomoides polygyrus]